MKSKKNGNNRGKGKRRKQGKRDQIGGSDDQHSKLRASNRDTAPIRKIAKSVKQRGEPVSYLSAHEFKISEYKYVHILVTGFQVRGITHVYARTLYMMYILLSHKGTGNIFPPIRCISTANPGETVRISWTIWSTAVVVV